MLDLSVITRVRDFHPSISLKCQFSYISISVPMAYSSKFLNFGSRLLPRQWIRSGCLVVNLKVSMLSSNIVIECSCVTKCCMGARQQKYANLDTSILDIAIL